MKDDCPAAAQRLMLILPVRTHVRLVRDLEARESAKNVRPVSVGGARYESLAEASRQLRVSREKIRNMIKNGNGRYLGLVHKKQVAK